MKPPGKIAPPIAPAMATPTIRAIAVSLDVFPPWDVVVLTVRLLGVLIFSTCRFHACVTSVKFAASLLTLFS